MDTVVLMHHDQSTNNLLQYVGDGVLIHLTQELVDELGESTTIHVLLKHEP